MDTAGCYGHPTKCRKSPSDESLEGANRWLRQETVSPRDAEVLVTHGLQVRQLQVTVLWLPQQAGEMGKAGILTSLALGVHDRPTPSHNEHSPPLRPAPSTRPSGFRTSSIILGGGARGGC